MKPILCTCLVLAIVHSVLSQGSVNPGSGTNAQYAELHKLLIGFYQYQRAGLSSGNPYNPFYGYSPYPHSNDRDGAQDLSGGWYDAGDFVKFGLPLGFSVYCLLKGYDVFPGSYDDLHDWTHTSGPNGIPDILDETRFATDYLIKAVESSNAIVMDVGNAQADHSVWANGYGASGDRTVYKYGIGADVPGLYAAGLALMSRLYKQYDASYAATCLNEAKTAYAYANNHRSCTSGWQIEGYDAPYYSTETWEDKLGCAAIELYLATNEASYLTQAKAISADVKSHYSAIGHASAGDFMWYELKRLGESTSSKWFTDLNNGMSQKTVNNPGSLVHGAFVNTNWGVCGLAGGIAFSCGMAYILTGENKYRDYAFQQVDWIAGFSSGSRSYVTRYNGGPNHPHHRNDATIGSVNLVGGIVSGPTVPAWSCGDWMDPQKADEYQWTFEDNVAIYENTEVALDYNAGPVGAVAFVRYYNNPGDIIRINTAIAATPAGEVNFNVTSYVTITMGLESAQNWTIRITGETSGATKSFTGTGSTVSQQWYGDVDNGSFVSGETVAIEYIDPKIADYHLNKARTSLHLVSMKDADFRSSDVLIDNFNDEDSITALGGYWTGFSDSTEGIADARSPQPRIFFAEGKAETKGLYMQLAAWRGADQPYAGVKAAFNSAGTPVSLGGISSIVFDIKITSAKKTVRFEFEQKEITDGAYHGKDITLQGDSWVRMRILGSELAQPDWKAGSVSFNGGSFSALRFANYSTGTVQLYLDNVHIENLEIGEPTVLGARHCMPAGLGGARLTVTPEVVVYSSRSLLADGREVTVLIYNTSGKRVYRNAAVPANGTITLPGVSLPSGIYVFVDLIGGTSGSTPVSFTILGR